MCIFINKMRPRIQLGITWSLEELKKLIDDENSSVYMERSRKHVALHPIHLNDLNKAFHDILGSSINFYDPQFKGLLLAYKNPKLLSQLGTILYDSHFIHVDIEADFYIFRPEEKRILTGVVNKKADNYIGVLVHKAFNVSIPKREEEENWEGDNLEVGDDVTFTVVHVDLKGKLPFIRGTLPSSNTSTSKTSDEISTTASYTIFNSDEESGNDTRENSLESVSASEQIQKSNRPSFLSTLDSDSSDEDLQPVNKEAKDKKLSKLSKKSSKSIEKCHKEQIHVKTNTTIHDDDNNPFVLNEGEKSKKLSKDKGSKSSEEKSLKSSKKSSKERHIAEENNVINDDNLFNRTTSSSHTENEIPISIKTSRKRKLLYNDESSLSEPIKKISKHKKRVKTNENYIQNNVNDERDNISSIDSEAEASRVSSGREERSKFPKTSSKHKEKIETQQNYSHAEEESVSSIDSEAETLRVLSGREKRSKSPKKSSKHKKKIKLEQNNSHVEEQYTSSIDSEAEASRILSGREKRSKSPKKSSKHKERIKVEQSDAQTHLNDGEISLSYIDNEMEDSRNLSQNEKFPKSPKKSSKNRSRIKEERIDPSTDSHYEEEHNQSLEAKFEKSTETTKLLQSGKHVKHEKEHSKSRKNHSQHTEQTEVVQTDVQSNNHYLNDEDTASSQNKAETSTKSSMKKKRSSNHEEILSIKIKEEPISDSESGLNKKSKRKRKDREHIDDSLNDQDTEIPDDDSNSKHKKQKDKEKEPVSNPVIGKIRVKQEFIVKEEVSRKKKNKEDRQPILKIKRESTSSDVEGTAVKKKIKTFFTE